MKLFRTALAFLVLVLTSTPSFAQAETVVYFHSDAIGSVRLTTDAAGQVLERYDYLPFGEPYPSSASVETRRFGGKERDAETGLDYFGARYYSSLNGRFITVDPIYVEAENVFDPQRWNKYAYSRNNPYRYVDPDGRLLDTILDVAFTAYDVFDIGRSVYRGQGVSASQVGALAADVAGIFVPFATGGGTAIRAAAKADDVAHLVKAAEKADNAVSLGKKADFVVTADGTAISVSQSRMRKGFDAAGFPSRPAAASAEAGMIHEVPTKYGSVDVRTMEGGANHPRRAVTSRPGTNDPTRLSGERFKAGEPKRIRRDESHLEQEQ